MTKIHKKKNNGKLQIGVPVSQNSCNTGFPVSNVIGYPQSQTNRDIIIYMNGSGGGAAVILDNYVFYGITGLELNTRYPELKVGDSVYSQINSVRFEKISPTHWEPIVIEII